VSGIELVPRPARLVRVVNESADVKSFELEFIDGGTLESLPGQFVEVSVQGYGEATFAVSRLAGDRKRFTVSVKRMGHLTKMLHRAAEGETVGARGPYGKPFPVESWKGRHVYIIGGGIGLAPLRPVVDYVLAHRSDYAGLEILFGARTPQDMLFKDDLAAWAQDSFVKLHSTIDFPAEGWSRRVGFVPVVVKDLRVQPDNRVAVVCGPPIMIKLTAAALKELGWPESSIYTTLEMKMQCGIGQCGRCNIGGKLVCKDGPVFRLDEIPGWAF
jgi:sulfhydrogenase subunit gamma (sulfur reductase)